MALQLRNVDVDPSEPLESWPFEALVTLIERGSVTDLVRLTRAIGRDTWGPVTRQVEEYLSYENPAGVGPLLARRIERARTEAEAAERAAVAGQVAELIGRSGLTLSEFATRIGTSRSRLSTYRSGSVTPSAALLLRMQRVAQRTVAT